MQSVARALLLALFCALFLSATAAMASWRQRPLSVVSTAPSTVDILTAVFDMLGVKGVDPRACVSDVANFQPQMRDFEQALNGKQYTAALEALGGAASALALSVNGCGVPQVQARLDAFAGALHWANATVEFDKLVSIVVGAADLTLDMQRLAKAVTAADGKAIGSAIGQLLGDWTHIVGGCTAGNKVCSVLDGLLKIIQVVAPAASACEAALQPVVPQLNAALQQFSSKQYKTAIADLATALDTLAKAISQDSCGLQSVGQVIGDVIPSLKSAIVQIDASGEVRIVVGSANLYIALFNAATALQHNDMHALGLALGQLTQQLQASACKTPACSILLGLLQAAQIEVGSFAQCRAQADAAWSETESAFSNLIQGDFTGGVRALSGAVREFSLTLSDCNVPRLSEILARLASNLGDAPAAVIIGEITSAIVDGADVSLHLVQAAQDFDAGRWSAAGSDLLTLSKYLDSNVCHSVACEVVHGLLLSAGTAMEDLQACVADLKTAEKDMIVGAQLFAERNYNQAMSKWSATLAGMGTAIKACGLQQQLGFIQQEANVLGIANVTNAFIGDSIAILIHGADFLPDMAAVLNAALAHDFRTMGVQLKKVLDELYTWTQGHACTSNFCYVTIGVLEFVGNVEGDFRRCVSDTKFAFSNFTAAYAQFSSRKGGIFNWAKDASKIKAGCGLIGHGLDCLAAATADCHLQQFSDLIAALAARFALVPEVGWLEAILHILINGVHIEKELSSALIDFSQDNWVGFGWEVASLIKTLL